MITRFALPFALLIAVFTPPVPAQAGADRGASPRDAAWVSRVLHPAIAANKLSPHTSQGAAMAQGTLPDPKLPPLPPPPTALIDFGRIRGANYFPGYARSSFTIWQEYQEHVDQIEVELGFAEQLELNSLRVFLSYLSYELDPPLFIAELNDFLLRCEAHGISPMLVLFDSAFGISPSPETDNEYWVTSPGSHLVTPDFYPKGEEFVDAVMQLSLERGNVLAIDIMNEPWNTSLADNPVGTGLIFDFLFHFSFYINANRSYDPIARTIGFQVSLDYTSPASPQYLPVNVVSVHSYSPVFPNGTFELDLARGIGQANAAGLPFIISECGKPGAAIPQTYEDIMPVLHGQQLNFYVWDVVIGTDTWKGLTGVFYDDGKVRNRAEALAITENQGTFVEKSPLEPDFIALGVVENKKVWFRRAFERMLATPTGLQNAGERFTVLYTMSTAYKPDGQNVYFPNARAEQIETMVQTAIGLITISPASGFAILDVLIPFALDALDEKTEHSVTLPVVAQ